MLSMHKAAPLLMWSSLILISPLLVLSLMTNSHILVEWSILTTKSLNIQLPFLLDPYGLMFSMVVILISANVLQFSTIYMKDDQFIDRFTKLVILFILSMNFLIYLPNFMALLLGWDGLGITSFILVIYYQNPKSLAAGLITAITNRIGDALLLLAIAWTLNQGHWNIIHMWPSEVSTLQVMCIMVAAMTKSAQMPFSSWLPAAMAAPTPVSALVHSSTLVTAGVFLIIRFYPFLSSIPLFNKILLFLAVSTMLMAGISATTECDMKKIIALSTLSQLGMMMTSLGLGLPTLAYFHMAAHALFKSLLFICAGSFINSHTHSQDLRWMGNLTSQFPAASSCLLVANTALCGFPFMAGFYSKDMIIEAAMFNSYNSLMVSLAMFTVGLTSLYSLRFSMVVVWGPTLHTPLSLMTEEKSIVYPMMIMSITSIMGGAAIQWILPMNSTPFILPTSLKSLTILMVGAGLVAGWLISKNFMSPIKPDMAMSMSASCSMWYLVPLSSQFTMKGPLLTAHSYLKNMDQSWLELIEGQGVNKFISSSSNSIMKNNPVSPSSYLSMSVVSSMTLMMIMLMA